MNRQEVQIPIPKDAIEVTLDGHVGTYFVNPDPAKQSLHM